MCEPCEPNAYLRGDLQLGTALFLPWLLLSCGTLPEDVRRPLFRAFVRPTAAIDMQRLQYVADVEWHGWHVAPKMGFQNSSRPRCHTVPTSIALLWLLRLASYLCRASPAIQASQVSQVMPATRATAMRANIPTRPWPIVSLPLPWIWNVVFGWMDRWIFLYRSI